MAVQELAALEARPEAPEAEAPEAKGAVLADTEGSGQPCSSRLRAEADIGSARGRCHIDAWSLCDPRS